MITRKTTIKDLRQHVSLMPPRDNQVNNLTVGQREHLLDLRTYLRSIRQDKSKFGPPDCKINIDKELRFVRKMIATHLTLPAN